MTDSNGITVFAGNLFGLSQLLEDIAEFIDIIKKDITGGIADTIFTGDTAPLFFNLSPLRRPGI